MIVIKIVLGYMIKKRSKSIEHSDAKVIWETKEVQFHEKTKVKDIISVSKNVVCKVLFQKALLFLREKKIRNSFEVLPEELFVEICLPNKIYTIPALVQLDLQDYNDRDIQKLSNKYVQKFRSALI